MSTIKRSALVPYTPRQMFELVNNIEDYPRFLPWCHQSHVLSKDEKGVRATLDIAWSGIHKSFTTHNHLYPYDRIEITLLHGPFRRLQGTWAFIALNEEACKVCLDLEFELTGHLVDKI